MHHMLCSLQVHPKSPSAKRGLRPGDMVLAICRTPAANLTHDQAKMEILRAGNELDFTVQRSVLIGNVIIIIFILWAHRAPASLTCVRIDFTAR